VTISSASLGRRLRLRPGVYRTTAPDGRVTLFDERKWGQALGTLTGGEEAAVRALATGDREASEPDEATDTADLERRLLAGGWLIVQFHLGPRRLMTVRPLGPPPEGETGPPAVPQLSRFAVLRSEGGSFVLASPLSRAVIEVHDPAVLSLLHHLTGPAGTPDPSALGLPAAAVTELLGVLAAHRFVHEAGTDVSPGWWSPHELWFHVRSRAGHHDEPHGARPVAARSVLPARREPWPGPAVDLPEPAPGRLGQPLAAVLARRRSLRTPAPDTSLTIEALSEFLHWSSRARPAEPGDDGEISSRPSPSGGARHGIEVYLVVSAVAGLTPGMYHYDPFGHRLEPVPSTEVLRRRLLDDARAAAAGSPPPHVLLVFSARFGRTMGKYRGMAYALILKDLGALMQTMYLVATALGLAPCALGSGDVEVFARATGVDPLHEASVGEFMLSAAAPASEPSHPDGGQMGW